jgi:hypothetical protein
MFFSSPPQRHKLIVQNLIARCYNDLPAPRYLPPSRRERQSRRKRLVRHPPNQKCQHETRYRKPHVRRHSLLLLSQSCQRRDRPRWRNHPLHLDARSQPPRPNTVLPRQSPRWRRREDLGWQRRSVVPLQHDHANRQFRKANELAGSKYLPTTLPYPTHTYSH